MTKTSCSTALAPLPRVFKATVFASFSVCKGVNIDHHPGCLFTRDWNEIYQFLVANGKCSAILGVARRHDLLQHTAMLLADITRRSPRQSARGKGQDERCKTAKTTEVGKLVWERCEPISENTWYYDRSK